MVGGWWNVALLIVAVVGSLVLWDCQASNGTSSCSKPNITRLNFVYFVSILNGSNRTLSCEIRSDTPLKEAAIWRRVSSSLPDGHSVVNSSCSFLTNTICVMSNLTLIHVVRGHYEGNYTLTAENDCGKASVYVVVNIMVPPTCGSDYNKPPELLKPPPLIVLAVQGGSVTIKAEYKGNVNDHNLLAYWCVTTLDGNRCIFPTDNDTSYNVTTIHSCPSTDPDCCYFTTAIEIKSLTLDLSQANLTSVAIWLQNPKSFNPGNTTLVVNVFPTLDKWLPSPNNSVEIDEGQSTEFMCVYNASTDPIITMTTWKFEEDYLEHNTSHHVMTTEYGTDPANANRVLSKFILSNVGLGNAGTYTCRCVYNRNIIYSKEPVYSGAESFHVKVKPRAKSGHTPYVKIVVAVGVIAIVVICVISFTILIWRRLKTHKALERASNEADQSNGDLDHNTNENGHTSGENGHDNGQSNGHDNGQSNGQSSSDSDQNSDDENAQLLGKNEQCRPMMEYPPPADHVTGKSPKSYGGVNDTIRKVINSPKKKRPKRRNLGAARYTSQADSEDQLLSGQECSDISKGGLIPSHQKTNHQDGEMIPGTINPDTTNTATTTGVTSRTIEADGPTAITTVPTGIKQPSIPYGNICPPNTEPDTKGARYSGQLPTKPLLRDPLPSDRPIESDAGRPKLSDGNELSSSSKETGHANEKLARVKRVKVQSAKMTNRIKQALINNNVDVVSLIKQLCAMSTVKNKEVPLFDVGLFKKIKSINDFWKILECFLKMFDYELLWCVIEMSECREAQQIFEEFISEVYPSESPTEDMDLVLYCEEEHHEGSLIKPVLRIKVNSKECTPDVKERVEEIISKACKLEKYALCFQGIKGGCIELFYYISQPLKIYLLQFEFSKSILKDFCAHKIISLHIDEFELDTTNETYTWHVQQLEKDTTAQVDESEGPQKPPPAEDTQRNESEFEQAVLLQESEIPVTDLHCINNHSDPSGTSEPCVEHEGKRSKAPEPPSMPLTCIPTGDPIESEREVPNTSLPAKCAAPTSGKDMTKLSDYGDILNSVAPDLRDANMESLLSYLQKHLLVTRDEEHHLTIMLHSPVVKSQMLLGYLKHKGRDSLQKFLCSLNLAHEHIAHKGIADKLKKAMQANGIDCDDFCSDCCKKS